MISYGRQFIDDEDIAAVVAVLKSDYLTQGPAVAAFEEAFAAKVGAKHAIAVNSGTAALHACTFALRLGPSDEVIVPPITFTATANCALFVGATPVFADVTPSGHIDPAQIEKKLTNKTKAVIAVDYAGIPCDYERILAICKNAGIPLICDACHSLGAAWRSKPTGSIGLLNCFSFHPVKHIATGEGGMVTTDDDTLAQTIRDFRTHGITKDASRFLGLTPNNPFAETFAPLRSSVSQNPLDEFGPWYYEMHALGFNYRMSDINAALGLSQLKKLDRFVARRREIAARYTEAFSAVPHLKTPSEPGDAASSWHLYPVQIDFEKLGRTRTAIMQTLRDRGIGTQVHYIPVHLQPFYRARLDTRAGQCPASESLYPKLLSLPMFAAMTEADVALSIESVRATLTI